MKPIIRIVKVLHCGIYTTFYVLVSGETPVGCRYENGNLYNDKNQCCGRCIDHLDECIYEQKK